MPRRDSETPITEVKHPWTHGAADIPGNMPETSLTDLGNARRLVIASGENLRYCHAIKRWFSFNGVRWVKDDVGEIFRVAKNSVRGILTEAAMAASDAERKAVVAHQQKSESDPRIKAMIHLAESEPGIPVRLRDLDSDPMLFNVLNGTVDLKTGNLLDFNKSDLITRVAPVEYDPEAIAPTWEKFLADILPDPSLVEFVQRATGYSLIGSALEHVLFLLYGVGANGKSTFLEVVRHVFGDYAASADFGTFLAQKGQSIRNDIARLHGARLVTAVESGAGRRLDESIVKSLTGGDTVAARFLYSEAFEFVPAFKLFLATNHKPRIAGSDESIWRRVRLVPFSVTVPKEKRDHDLPARLKDEASGILNWALRGLRDYQDHGLGEPLAVDEATEQYRQDQDVLGHFIDAKLTVDPDSEVRSSELYRAYKVWAQEAGEYVLNERDFSTAMLERGISKKRKLDGNYWLGIEIRF